MPNKDSIYPGDKERKPTSRKPILRDDQQPKYTIPVPDSRMFAGFMGEIAEEASDGTETDRVAAYACMLSIAGMMVGRKPHVMIGNRRHPLLIWPLMIGRSGAGRKGDAVATATLLFGTAFAELHDLTVTGLSTGEGLIFHICDDNTDDKRLLVNEEELGHIIAVSSKETSTLASVIRKAWDGGPLQSLTKNSPYKASWSHVAIIAAITPSEFRSRVSDRDLASGLWNRYLPLYVERRQLVADPEGMSSELLEKYCKDITKAVGKAATIGRIMLSESARDLLEAELYPEFADLIDEEGRVADFLERGPAYLRRVSALTAALDGRSEARPSDLQSAACFVRYSLASARYALDDATRDPRLDRLQRAADEAYPDLLSRTWIANSLFQKNIKADDIQEVIDTLCTDERYRNDRGRQLYAEREIPRRDGRGRGRRMFGRVSPSLRS